VQEAYGLVWVRLVDDGPRALPVMEEWSDPDYLQVLPNAADAKKIQKKIDQLSAAK